MSKNDMLYSIGVMPSISSMIRCLTDVGDEILIQTPVYHVFFYVIEDNNRRVLENQLIYENGEYKPDDEDSIGQVLLAIDMNFQYYDDKEPNTNFDLADITGNDDFE